MSLTYIDKCRRLLSGLLNGLYKCTQESSVDTTRGSPVDVSEEVGTSQRDPAKHLQQVQAKTDTFNGPLPRTRPSRSNRRCHHQRSERASIHIPNQQP